MVTLLQPKDVAVPADVPGSQVENYLRTFLSITRGTGRLHLFAGDQKAEHLNDDFFGAGIHPDDGDPEHMFRIAGDPRSQVSVFAGQYGLISRYARDYPNISYLVKVNSKTHVVPTAQAEPVSPALCTFEMIDRLVEAGLDIAGVGLTCYTGSEGEGAQYQQACRYVSEAHRRGMIAVLWMYPRGKAVAEEKDPHLIAGAAGVACVLGADFAKVNPPKVAGGDYYQAFREATRAAGRTRVITAGGSATDAEKFYLNSYKQITVSGCVGAATGRNIHQKGLEEAVRFSNGLASIIFADKEPAYAMACFKGKQNFEAEAG